MTHRKVDDLTEARDRLVTELAKDPAYGVEPIALSEEGKAAGLGCTKGCAGCLCRVGFQPEDQCQDCRSDTPRRSHCECPPKDGEP